MAEKTCKESVYQSIFLEHAEKIRNFIYYKSGDNALAEDMVQEAFIKLWINCSKVEVYKAKSFLYTVANNLFLNRVSHRKYVLKFEIESRKKSEVPDPQFLMEEEEFRIRLKDAINDLPHDQRIVFLMSRVDKKKYREIAEEIGIGVKAVEKRMNKALIHLKKIHEKV